MKDRQTLTDTDKQLYHITRLTGLGVDASPGEAGHQSFASASFLAVDRDRQRQTEMDRDRQTDTDMDTYRQTKGQIKSDSLF